MAITITANTEAVQAELRRLGRDAPKAVARALNRTIQSVQTRAVRDVAKDLGIVQKAVRAAMKIRKATRTLLMASLAATGRRIPLIYFGARGPEPSRGRGRGVTYRLTGGRTTIKEAFIASVPYINKATGEVDTHRGVFRRMGIGARKSKGAWSMNLPIKQLYGPSVPHVFKKHIDAALQQYADELLAKNMNHEVEYLLSRQTPAGDELAVAIDSIR